MGLRLKIAKVAGVVSDRVLRCVFHRPAANFPGKAGLLVDPSLIGDLRGRLREGSVVVVGTNGKTTVTNLLADSLEAAGKTVACNRTGANLDSGVASALLKADAADWGVFECDELWLAKVAPQLQPRFVVLLNLFRDQLDRMGEIDHIQESIAGALAASPSTVLLYNCDDPLCQAIADAVENDCVAFGIDEALGLARNSVVDADICPRCGAALEYQWRQYGQLGAYRCPACGFGRPEPAYAAFNVAVDAELVSLDVRGACSELSVAAHLAGAYSAYNVLAACAIADRCAVPHAALRCALESFAPHNGRLQHYRIDGCDILLNLAKNPMGFNQNLRIVESEPGSKAIAFFINDKEADGHDVSWLWDVDFQELVDIDGLCAFAGGIRRNDMQVRLKYAGIDAGLVDGAKDFIRKACAELPEAKLFLIANYTALPTVKAELDALARAEEVITSEHTYTSCTAEPLGNPRSKPDEESAPGPLGQPQSNPDNENEPEPLGKHQSIPNENSVAEIFRKPNSKPVEESTAELLGKFKFKPDEESAPGPLGKPDSKPVEESSASAYLLFRRPYESTSQQLRGERLVIVHFYPRLLNLYGDGGNVTVLAERARRRGVDVEVVSVDLDDHVSLDDADIVFLGGGPDREQRLAAERLAQRADELRAYVEEDGVLLAICGGYQILGKTWILDGESVEGLGLVDVWTERAEGGSHNRLVGNIAIKSPLACMPVIGYENHAGRTFLGSGCQPFGRIVGHCGKGNNDKDGVDGALYRNVVGTYLHGPLLAKSPEVADALIARALARRAEREGRAAPTLPPLDDAMEHAANKFMAAKLNLR